MQRKAIRIYWIGSFLAVLEGFVLFTLGLDLRFEQIRILLSIAPLPILCMYLCDRWLIVRHTQPLETVWRAQNAGQVVSPEAVRTAYLQALNLPILTLLRVLTIHAPAVLLPATLLGLVANQIANLGFSGWQFFVIWSLWPITSVPHATVEYFLIERLVRPLLLRLESTQAEPITTEVRSASLSMIGRMVLGFQPTSPHVIRTSTGVQLGWLLFFVSLMPMFVLGTSVFLKIATTGNTSTEPALLSSLGMWIGLLIVLNTAISVAIVSLLSRRVRTSLQEFLGHMQRVLRGDLAQLWSPRTTDEFLDLGAGFNAMVQGLRERENLKDTFGRFVSQDVAAAVLGNRVSLHGELREVTVLFQDIRGFTSLSEQTPPPELLQLLNTFFTEMVAAVEAHGGIVKQFTGDGVMALFGAPVSHDDEPIRAVRAALAMLARLEVLNQQRLQRGEVALRIGIGIHTGDVVVGRIGPDTRVEYGVVGDSVNVASRVQDLTKEIGATILITDATAARLDHRFTFGKQAVLAVRGKTQPIRVIEILGESAA